MKSTAAALLFLLVSLAVLAPLTRALPCPTSTPSASNPVGCLLYSFPVPPALLAPDNYVVSATYDAVAQPNTLILSVIFVPPLLLVTYVNGTFYMQLDAPGLVAPQYGVVDSGGAVFIMDNGGQVFVFSPYPAYALTQTLSMGYEVILEGSLAIVQTLAGEFLLLANRSGLAAWRVGCSDFQVTALTKVPVLGLNTPLFASSAIAISPLTGQLALVNPSSMPVTGGGFFVNAVALYNLTYSATAVTIDSVQPNAGEIITPTGKASVGSFDATTGQLLLLASTPAPGTSVGLYFLSLDAAPVVPQPPTAIFLGYVPTGGEAQTIAPDGSIVTVDTTANNVVFYYQGFPSNVSSSNPGRAGGSRCQDNSAGSVSASTGPGSAFSDPRFVGFWGQEWYVGGEAGGVYNLLSDSQVQVNALFVYLSNVTCPVQQDGTPVDQCFDEAGTYFGQVAIRVQGGEWVRVVGGPVTEGFASVDMAEGVAVRVGDSHRVLRSGGGSERSALSGEVSADSSLPSPTFPTSRALQQLQRAGLHSRLRGGVRTAGGTGSDGTSASTLDSPLLDTPVLSVHRTSARRLTVSAGAYTFTLSNMDGYVDVTRLHSTCWDCVTHHLQPDGLLGQTWNKTANIRGQSEKEVEEYREMDDQLLGCHLLHDRFCSQAAPLATTTATITASSALRPGPV